MAGQNVEWSEIIWITKNDYGDSFEDLQLNKLSLLSSYHSLSEIQKGIKIVKSNNSWSFVFGYCVLKGHKSTQFIENKWRFDKVTLTRIELNELGKINFESTSFSLSCIRNLSGVSIVHILEDFFIKNIANLTESFTIEFLRQFFYVLHKTNYYTRSRYSFDYLLTEKVIDPQIKLYKSNEKYWLANQLVSSFHFERKNKTSYKLSGDHKTSHYISLDLPRNNYLKALLLKLYGNRTNYKQFDPDNIFLTEYKFLSEHSIRFHVVREDSDVDIPDGEFIRRIEHVKNKMLVDLYDKIDVLKYNISNLSNINFLDLLKEFGRFEL